MWLKYMKKVIKLIEERNKENEGMYQTMLDKLKQNDEAKQGNKDKYKSIKYERRWNKMKDSRRKVMLKKKTKREKNKNEEKIQTNRNRTTKKSKSEERKKALRNIKLIAEWQSTRKRFKRPSQTKQDNKWCSQRISKDSSGKWYERKKPEKQDGRVREYFG